MMATEEAPQNHGASTEWTDLTEEESRCLAGLKKYYILFEEKVEEEALEKAWRDIQREFPRLTKFKWYKQ
jgi:hypothetical protein